MESIARAKAIFVLLYFIFEKVVTFLVCVWGDWGGIKSLHPEAVWTSRVALLKGIHNQLVKCYIIP